MVIHQNTRFRGTLNFPEVYAGFHIPLSTLDCGKKCSPYNENGIPFCCDTRHAVPTAFLEEWAYLSTTTDLWHLWQAETIKETRALQIVTPPNQVLIECKGHLLCQREYRSLTCRAFPFFPYIDREGVFTGLAYYWEFEDRCWVINHLESVSKMYTDRFVRTYERIFHEWPHEMEQFQYHSKIMRQVFGRKKRAIHLIHHDGSLKAVNTRNGILTALDPHELPKFGPYQVATKLRFPDEINEC